MSIIIKFLKRCIINRIRVILDPSSAADFNIILYKEEWPLLEVKVATVYSYCMLYVAMSCTLEKHVATLSYIPTGVNKRAKT